MGNRCMESIIVSVQLFVSCQLSSASDGSSVLHSQPLLSQRLLIQRTSYMICYSSQYVCVYHNS